VEPYNQADMLKLHCQMLIDFADEKGKNGRVEEDAS